MKNNGILWAVGASVVGLGAWAYFAKRAAAQEPVPDPPEPAPIVPDVFPPNVPDNGNVIDEEFKQFVFDSPTMTLAAAEYIRTWLSDQQHVIAWKAQVTKLAQACLPWGKFITAELLPAPDGVNAVMRMTFGYLGDIDAGVVKECMRRGGV